MNAVTAVFEWIEARLEAGLWYRRGVYAATVYLAVRLSGWAGHFADRALDTKADLLGVAAVIAAVAGVPLALLTLLYNKYVDSR